MKTNTKILILGLILLFALILLCVSSPVDRFMARLPALLLLIGASLALLLFFIKKENKNYTFFKIIPLSILIIFAALEIVHMFWMPRVESFGSSLAAQLWYTKYWEPINSYGFRDVAVTQERLKKKKIFVMGDAFVAGHGIENTADRFSNLLQQQLPPSYEVFNLGYRVADTYASIFTLRESPIQPDVVVLTYYIDDIDKVAMRAGLKVEHINPYGSLPTWLAAFVKHFYIVDYLFWNGQRNDFEPYKVFLKKAYDRLDVFNNHKKDIQNLINYTKQKDIQLLIVLTPSFLELALSNEYLAKVETLIKENGVMVLNLGKLAVWQDAKQEQIVNNINDASPTEWVHRIVADEIAKKMKELEIVK